MRMSRSCALLLAAFAALCLLFVLLSTIRVGYTAYPSEIDSSRQMELISAPGAPSASPTAAPWPPPTITPIVSLLGLVQHSDAIVHASVQGTNGAQHSWIIYLDVRDWLKPLAVDNTVQATVWIPNAFAGEFTGPRSFWNRSDEEVILFLRTDGLNPWDNSPAFKLTGAPNGDTSIYQIRDGKIADAGLPQYQGWAVADFEAEIRALLTHPELGASLFPH